MESAEKLIGGVFMNVWEDYFCERMVDWTFHKSSVDVENQRSIFDDCFVDAEAEFHEGLDTTIQIVRWFGPHPILSYWSKGCIRNVELRWWAVRRIRAIRTRQKKSGTWTPQVEGLVLDSIPERRDINESISCHTLQAWYSNFAHCLRNSTSKNERLAHFAALIFGGYQLSGNDVEAGETTKPIEQLFDEVPLKCVGEILERFGLSQEQVEQWYEESCEDPQSAYRARFRGKKKLTDCLIRQFGSEWMSVLLQT